MLEPALHGAEDMAGAAREEIAATILGSFGDGLPVKQRGHLTHPLAILCFPPVKPLNKLLTVH